jgi:hypothetical protein
VDGFQVVQRKRPPNGGGRRKFVVSGTDDGETEFRGGSSPSRYLFVYNCNDSNEEKIDSFMRRKGVIVREIKLVSNEKAIKQSYRIEISIEDKTKLLEGQFWPKLVKVRNWYGKVERNINREGLNTSMTSDSGDKGSLDGSVSSS